ncbi:MAG: site-specific DNA-methyltransferase [Gemmatimonadota bacterium]|nr:site-specific DNA-methyltransferase [Gemmatimonadota bacterium]
MKEITVEDSETQSNDIVAENVAHLKSLFPEAFTEDKIDFEVLKQILGGTVDEREEKYGLNWHGKRQARQLALTPSTGTLRPCPEESVNWDSTQNLMIEGDNLEVLKLLQKSYAGKVKLIYIDPPYNTGKDFIYPDNYRDNILNYLDLTSQVDNENRRLSSNTETSGRFHTDWMNMIYPRLKLARNLLSNDGVMLVSVNDIEVVSLRLALNEVFGEENFLCQFIWNNEGNVDQQSKIKGVHEYIVAYARRLEEIARPSVIDLNIEESSKLFNDEIENSITKNGPANPPSKVTLPMGFPADFQEGIIPKRTDQYPHILDEIVVRHGKLKNTATVESGWSSKNLLELFVANGCIPIQDNSGKETRFALTKTGAIYGYKQRSELQGHVLSVIRNVGTTKQNSGMLKRWGITFSYPKPVLLLQYLAQIFTSPDSHDMVLDFFAGSGTMGHAVLKLNNLDGGHRRFGLVQFPEVVEDESEEHKTLFDLCRKRIGCAIDELSHHGRVKQSSVGFRVFKLDSSNIRSWEPDRDDLEGSLLQNVEHIKPDRSEVDILYELLLKLGLDLCVPIETRTIAGKSVHSIGASTLIVCLDEEIDESDIEVLAHGISEWHKEAAPAGDTTVVFRDSAFADDIAKTNLTAILEQRGLGNVRSL